MKFPLLATTVGSRKRVLVRVGFDVATDKKGRVVDTFRLERSLPTLRWLLSRRASLFLLAHRGQPHGRRVAALSLKPVVPVLARLLRRPVTFFDPHRKSALPPQANRPGSVTLFENLRFDLREERPTQSFAAELARYGDVYVNEDFSTSHRAQTSLVLLPKLLPHAAGLNLVEEVKTLERLLRHTPRPFYILLGGAKVEDKLGAVTNLLRRIDGLLVGGVAASTLLATRGVPMGRSLLDTSVQRAQLRTLLASKKVHLPVDVIVAVRPTSHARTTPLEGIRPSEAAYDLGPATVAAYGALLRKARTIFWAGSMGLTEQRAFRGGTKKLALAVPPSALSVVGGGDTMTALHELRVAKRFRFLSTGGGATLMFLAGEDLPALQAIQL